MTDTQCDQRRATPNQLLRALAHEGRRTVLVELAAHDKSTIDIATLSERIDSAPKTELYHRHLPVLADGGLVALKEGEDSIAYTPSECAQRVLAVVDDRFE